MTSTEQLMKAIEVVAQAKIDDAGNDLTVIGEISKIQHVDVGEYKVTYKDGIFAAFSLDPTVTYKLGEQVYVLVPQGDMSRKKMILGRAAYQNNTSLRDTKSLENFFLEAGPNIFNWYGIDGSAEYGICASQKEDWENLIDPAIAINEIFVRDQSYESADSDLQRWSRTYNYLKINASFKTIFTQEHFSGHYSLQITFAVKNPNYALEEGQPGYDPDAPEFINTVLDFGFSSFTGASPYKFIDWSIQNGYFEIPAGGFDHLVSVKLVQDGYMLADISATIKDGQLVFDKDNKILNNNNIFVSNINIRFAQKINMMMYEYYPWIETPYGDTLFNISSDFLRENVTLIAHLQHQDIDLVEQGECEIHWFRQKADSDSSKAVAEDKDIHGKTYYDYGGSGWYPIEKIIEQTPSDSPVLYELSDDKRILTVHKAAVPVFYRYKAVICYNTFEEIDGKKYYNEITRQSAVKEIVNLNSNYDLEIVLIEGEKTKYKVVNHNDFGYGGEPPRDWYVTWYIKTQDDRYIAISNKMTDEPVDVAGYSAGGAFTLYAQCYDPYELNPTGSDEFVQLTNFDEKAILQKDIMKGDGSDILIDWEGPSDFNYDATGGLHNDMDKREYILTPILRFKEGKGSDYAITVYAPDGVILKLGNYYLSNDETGMGICHNIDDSMMKDMYIDEKSSIHFHIKDTYSNDKTNNTFKIVITLLAGGEVFTTYKQVYFSKDGDQGTIGNEWKMQIKPCFWNNASDIDTIFRNSYRDDIAVPLIVHQEDVEEDEDEEGNTEQRKRWVQSDNCRVFLRPYVTRNGEPIEEGDKYEAYYYKAYWDVRMPGNATIPGVKYSSFLRLYHTTRDTTSIDIFDNANGGFYETGNDWLKIGSNYNNIKTNEAENQVNGLVGYTVYPQYIERFKDEEKFEDNETFGAVEVRFFDNAIDGTGSSIEDNQYRFVVKCQVDVYKTAYDKINDAQSVEAASKKVATIISYYPIDVFFDFGNIYHNNYNDNYNAFQKDIKINWPRFISYDASGYLPEFLNTDLEFKYANSINKEPFNWTPYCQSIRKIERKDTIEKISYRYEALPNAQGSQFLVGALSNKPEDTDFDNGLYYRNQIITFNLYGNIDINGWDGQGIDMNEDEGTIFAATLGAGFKEPSTNLFTGVLMGVDKSKKRSDLKGDKFDVNENYNEMSPYLTGLFGYQRGYQSFGLLENGTAFFGRADGGGRIILDGSNGTIYGGANGVFDTMTIRDPMWNTMRLNLVDLTHATEDPEKIADQYWNIGTQWDEPSGQKPTFSETSGIIQGFDGKYFTDSQEPNTTSDMPSWYKKMWQKAYIKKNGAIPWWLDYKNYPNGYSDLVEWNSLNADSKTNTKINYYNDVIIEINGVPQKYNPLNTSQQAAIAEMRRNGQRFSLSSFGPSRASTTPAIEIGQHIKGLMPGLIEYDDFENVFTDLKIPGDRNFMVTYDGTLWAMNGVFMGAIIGSNILGGRIQGAELGIGKQFGQIGINSIDIFGDPEARLDCNWRELIPPSPVSKNPLDINPWKLSKRIFSVDSDGNVGAYGIKIAGGSIDIGTFHIIGETTLKDANHIKTEETPSLVQTGKSDFIGLTHFYGNVGIAPQLDEVTHKIKNRAGGSIAQTGGVTVFGGIIDDNEDTLQEILAPHQLITNFLRDNADYRNSTSSFEQLIASVGAGHSLQDSSVFSIIAKNGFGVKESLNTEDTNSIFGHLYPFFFKTFRYAKEGIIYPISYFTTMNQFINLGDNAVSGLTSETYSGAFQGCNYFRIGPWGTEVQEIFIRNKFQREEDCTKPGPRKNGEEGNYRGYFGAVQRAGYKNAGSLPPITGAIGITTWDRNALIFYCDDNTAIRSRDTISLVSGNRTMVDKPNDVSTEKTENAIFEKDAAVKLLLHGYSDFGTGTLVDNPVDAAYLVGSAYRGSIGFFVRPEGSSSKKPDGNTWEFGYLHHSNIDSPTGIILEGEACPNGAVTGPNSYLWAKAIDNTKGLHLFVRDQIGPTFCNAEQNKWSEIFITKDRIIETARELHIQIYSNDLGKDSDAHTPNSQDYGLHMRDNEYCLKYDTNRFLKFTNSNTTAEFRNSAFQYISLVERSGTDHQINIYNSSNDNSSIQTFRFINSGNDKYTSISHGTGDELHFGKKGSGNESFRITFHRETGGSPKQFIIDRVEGIEITGFSPEEQVGIYARFAD